MAGVGDVKQTQVAVRYNGLHDVQCIPDSEELCEVDVMYAGQHDNGLHDVQCIPDSEELCEVDIMYAGQHVPNRYQC